MEEHTPPPVAVVAAMIAVALAAALFWFDLAPAGDAPAPWAAAPVPTLQPTPPIAVPPPAPAAPPPPAVYVERVEAGGQVTINHTDVDVTVCILARCP